MEGPPRGGLSYSTMARAMSESGASTKRATPCGLRTIGILRGSRTNCVRLTMSPRPSVTLKKNRRLAASAQARPLYVRALRGAERQCLT
jgi:hypothetical protein